MDDRYDIVVIGGGIAGYSAALETKKYGMSVLLVEKKNIGGCCLNHGCIPMKTLLSAAVEYESIQGKKWKAIEIPEYSFSWQSFKDECNEKISEMQEQIKSLLYSSGIEYVTAEVRNIKYNNEYEITFSDGLQKKRCVHTDNIIIATGSKPYEIRELAFSKNSIFVDEFWNLDNIPESVIIVGGGSAGCELAYALNVFGVHVTVVESKERILTSFNKKQVQSLKKKLQKSGVRFITGQSIVSVEEDKNSVRCILSNGEEEETEKIIIAAGRKSAIDIDVIKQLNLEKSKNGFITADRKGWTGQKGIYIVGDANGQNMLAHYAQMQAKAAVAEIAGEHYKMSFVPKCVYTNPQLASIGKSIDDSKEDIHIRIGNYRYEYLGMALATHETKGKITVLRDVNTDCIVGAQIIGANACELIHTIQGYMEEKIPCRNIIRYIFAHPSLSEGIREAIIDSYKGE